MPSPTWLVIGLGNPGPEHAGHRHNIGQAVLDQLATRIGGRFKAAPGQRAQVLEGRAGIGGPRMVLAKPTTYMNLSGGPTSSLAKYFHVDPAHVIAVHDDVDLDLDTIWVRSGGSEAGHNGLRDISKALGTRDYLRVRVGVSRPPGRRETADHVLSNFTAAERKLLPFVTDTAADAVLALIEDGLEAATRRFDQGGR